ncbi:hypothetical protein XBJ1_2129 [Xenorhabdus bovienii SS-2004]|uniref:Uncharacterized protein n=1 Tax=Xenorhabdus bovienii (strain SS-2004) TaxID=406818 RepID=D3V3E0_XENBS|nr:hypothetical protein XBJ1_2129 [Xenorhabdus bovienii SS-2004]
MPSSHSSPTLRPNTLLQTQYHLLCGGNVFSALMILARSSISPIPASNCNAR